eukprot:GFUD01031058.1.p1 GENE.GFUD01031058.1~~GFUD01031058.1.p1  ORF type:complete len:298 (+),score=24.42 GFUD01031058.1:242-1135(+)
MKEVEGENDKREINNLEMKLRQSRNIVDQLKEKIECPVCFEIPQTGPVPVCPNGHFVCNECKGDACPTCRVGMGDGKSLLAVTVIENIDHRCRFFDCGEFFPHDRIEEHAKVCGHRTVICPHSRCNRKVGLSKLLGHLNEILGDCSYGSDRIENVSLVDKVSAVQTLNFSASEMSRKGKFVSYKLHTFAYEDISFCIKVGKRDWLYHFYRVMFAAEEVCSEYKIEMTVHERNATSDDSVVTFKFCGKPCSIDIDEKEIYGLKIDKTGMEQILNKSRNGAFSVSFSIRKIPTFPNFLH